MIRTKMSTILSERFLGSILEPEQAASILCWDVLNVRIGDLLALVGYSISLYDKSRLIVLQILMRRVSNSQDKMSRQMNSRIGSSSCKLGLLIRCCLSTR
jgi:hypothetical protein